MSIIKAKNQYPYTLHKVTEELNLSMPQLIGFLKWRMVLHRVNSFSPLKPKDFYMENNFKCITKEGKTKILLSERGIDFIRHQWINFGQIYMSFLYEEIRYQIEKDKIKRHKGIS